jgi:hypothetical protein
MSSHETSSNVEDMHALLHELNSLNEMHAPDHSEGIMSTFNYLKKTVQAASGKGDTGRSQSKWASKACDDEKKKEIMTKVLADLTAWIGNQEKKPNAKDVVALKDALFHVEAFEKIWRDAVLDKMPDPIPPTSATST